MKYHQGIFKPKNPQKYVGDANNIVFRSGWEHKLFLWLDENPSILKWASEELVIPYVSPLDNALHRYFPDVLIEYRNAKGEVHKIVVEVKPSKQTKPPTPQKKQTKRYLNEAATYAVNKAKWEAADKWAKKNGWRFMVLTEYDLNIR